MLTLIISAGRVPKISILLCFDLSKVGFINNSDPEDEYREKSYSFEGNIFDLNQAITKLNEIEGFRLDWALISLGPRAQLIKAGSTETKQQQQLKK